MKQRGAWNHFLFIISCLLEHKSTGKTHTLRMCLPVSACLSVSGVEHSTYCIEVDEGEHVIKQLWEAPWMLRKGWNLRNNNNGTKLCFHPLLLLPHLRANTQTGYAVYHFGASCQPIVITIIIIRRSLCSLLFARRHWRAITGRRTATRQMRKSQAKEERWAQAEEECRCQEVRRRRRWWWWWIIVPSYARTFI